MKNPPCNIYAKAGGMKRNNSCFLCPFAKPNAKEVSYLALNSAYIRQAILESHKVDGAAELLSILTHSSPASAALHHTFDVAHGQESCCSPVCMLQLCSLQPKDLLFPASQASRAVPCLCMTPAVLTTPTAFLMSLPPGFTASVSMCHCLEDLAQQLQPSWQGQS